MKFKSKTTLAANAALSTIQSIAPPLAVIASRLGQTNDSWANIIALGAGLLAIFRDVAMSRGSELFLDIDEHKSEYIDAVVKSENFQATLLNVWEKHIRENSNLKRMRLRKFLLALGQGNEISTDLHTKIYTVIDQMTEVEAEIFGFIIKGSNSEMYSKMHLNQTSIPSLNKYPYETQLDALNSLHAYRLINISQSAVIGADITIKQVTHFGALFYKFILN